MSWVVERTSRFVFGLVEVFAARSRMESVGETGWAVGVV